MSASEISQHASLEVRAQMGRKRKTARWLAGQLNRSPNHVNRRLNGESEWNIGELVRTCELLDTTLDKVLPDDT